MSTSRFDSFRMKAICVALCTVYPVLAEAGVAGRVQFVAGDVRVVDAGGKASPLRKGQDVNEGDTLLSGPSGSAQLKMIDGAIVAVRPGTELKVIDYVFNDAEDGKESASFSLVKGGLRAITGVIGKTNKEKVKIATPTATIGIRGTDHEPVVITTAMDGVQPGTYDKVNVGATTLTTNAGMAVIAANQVGFAASPGQPPVILPKMPDFYRAAPTPTQEKQQEKEKAEQKQEQKQSSEKTAEKSTATAAADTATESSTTTAAAPATNLTAVDASGNTLSLANQTLTTSTGKTQTLTGDLVTSQPPPPTSTPSGAYMNVIAAYPATVPMDQGGSFTYPAMYSFGGPGSSLSRDAAGNLTGVTDGGTDHYEYRTNLSQSGATMADLGQHAATGMSWGRWQGGQVTHSAQYVGMDANGNWGFGSHDANGDFVIGTTYTNSAALGSGSLHWITSPVPVPSYLPQVLTGIANYTLVGGTRPTDQNGNIGTLNSASLGVNFTSQVANANINFSIANNNWVLQSGDMQLNDVFFSSYTGCTDTCVGGSLSKNGVQLGSTPSTTGEYAFASVNGSLTGSGLNGAALQYAVQEGGPIPGSTTGFVNNVIQGVAAFAGPTQDANAPFRAVMAVDGWRAGQDFSDDVIDWETAGLYRGSVNGGEAPAARVVDGPNGLTEFLGFATDFTGTTTSATGFETPATIKIGTAVNRDIGTITLGGTTINWGRWEGGSVDIYSRDGSVKIGSIDNSGRSIHWVTTPVMTGTSAFGNLPLTGTATYTLAGHTSPTDLLGNVGTLNAATLTADFGNARVNAGVNVSFNTPTNTSNWVMTANNIPIRGKDGFESATALNGIGGITHTASCTGASCGARTVGGIDGVFFGGAQGAVFNYGMATGATATGTNGTTFNPTNAVTGVAVMKR